MDPKHAEQQFLRGVHQFNARAFFDAHETWEEIWLGTSRPDKTFLQGIIQVSAAFHHYLRGNPRGALSLLRAGLRKLENFPAHYRHLELSKLRDAAERWILALASGEDPTPAELPQIRFQTR